MYFDRVMLSTRAAFAGALCFSCAAFNAAQAGPFETSGLDPTEAPEIKVSFTTSNHGSERSGAAPSVEFAFPASDALELHVKSRRQLMHEEGSSRAGFGDTELGAKWAILRPATDGESFALTIEPELLAPTGDASRGYGDGVWGITVPAIVGRTFQRFDISAQAAYFHAFASGGDQAFASLLVTTPVASRSKVGIELAVDAPTENLGRTHLRANVGLKFNATESLEIQGLLGRTVSNERGERITQAKLVLEYLVGAAP